MKKILSHLQKDNVAFYQFLLSIFVMLVSVIIIAISYHSLPPYIPIFNQLPWGNDRLVQTPGIFLPIALFLIFFVFNFIFTLIFYLKDSPLVGRIIASVTLLISIMNLIFTIRTILLV